MSAQAFEIARLGLLQTFLAGHKVRDGRAFAWSARIFPTSPSRLEETFKEDFEISADLRDAVWAVIDAGERKDKRLSFYELEKKFDAYGQHQLERSALILVCRLASIEGRFDRKTWHALTANGACPREAEYIADSYRSLSAIKYAARRRGRFDRHGPKAGWSH